MAPWTAEQHKKFLKELNNAAPDTSAVPGRNRDQFISHRQSYRASVKKLLDAAAKVANIGSASSGTSASGDQVTYFISLSFVYMAERNERYPTLFNTRDSMAHRIHERLVLYGISWELEDIKAAGNVTLRDSGPNQRKNTNSQAPQPPVNNNVVQNVTMYRAGETAYAQIKEERDQLRAELDLAKARVKRLVARAAPDFHEEKFRAGVRQAFNAADYELVLSLLDEPQARKSMPRYMGLMYAAASNIRLGRLANAVEALKQLPDADQDALAHVAGADLSHIILDDVVAPCFSSLAEAAAAIVLPASMRDHHPRSSVSATAEDGMPQYLGDTPSGSGDHESTVSGR